MREIHIHSGKMFFDKRIEIWNCKSQKTSNSFSAEYQINVEIKCHKNCCAQASAFGVVSFTEYKNKSRLLWLTPSAQKPIWFVKIFPSLYRNSCTIFHFLSILLLDFHSPSMGNGYQYKRGPWNERPFSHGCEFQFSSIISARNTGRT